MRSGTRVAVVTGGGRGIGRGITLRSGRSGLCAGRQLSHRRAGRGDGMPRSRGARIAHARSRSAPTWPTSSRGVGCVDETIQAHGRIDLWVNNAGVAPHERSDLLETTAESWDHVLDDQSSGTVLSDPGRRPGDDRVERRRHDRRAADRVHHLDFQPFASISRPEYCVSKAGLSMVAQLFAVRLAGQGIRVYEIRPGLIETAMTRPVRDVYDQKIAAGLTPITRWGTPDDVGRAVAAIAAGAISVFHGRDLRGRRRTESPDSVT